MKCHLWKRKPQAFLVFISQISKKNCFGFSVNHCWPTHHSWRQGLWPIGWAPHRTAHKSGAPAGGAGRCTIFSSTEAQRQPAKVTGISNISMLKWPSYLLGQEGQLSASWRSPDNSAPLSFKKMHTILTRMVIIMRTDNNNYWQGYGGIGMLMHCWWDCQMVHIAWKTVWWVLKR